MVAEPVQRGSVARTLRTPRWLRTEVLAALVVGLALVPEAIAFSVIAGVDPQTGLFAAALMAMTLAFSGGRPAMISAATGATALVMAPLVASHGVQYLVAAVILAGLVQVLLGVCGFARVLRFIPRPVTVGFMNGLAVLQFLPQLRELTGVPWAVYPVAAVALLLLFGLPHLTRAVPAPLVVVATLTPVVILLGWHVPTVADKGRLPQTWPHIALPDVPLTWDTLAVIAPFSLSMAVVGIMESLMTASLVDRITHTRSSKSRETWGQGIGNVVSGVFGTMGGCGIVGQTMVNVRISGARTRISTFLAGAFLLLFVVLLGDTVGRIPMAALAAVMIYVAWAQFDWDSVRPSTVRRLPAAETAVMLVTVAGTVLTHNLAVGVAAGVLAALVVFARRVARSVVVERTPDDDAAATYRVRGQLFFASAHGLDEHFRTEGDPARVVIDVSGARLWDATAVDAVRGVVHGYRERGTEVELVHLDAPSRCLLERVPRHH